MDEMRLVTATPLPTDTAVRSVESTPLRRFLNEFLIHSIGNGYTLQTANDVM